jgi:hypothetical protein
VGIGSEVLLTGLEDAINKPVCVVRAILGDIIPNVSEIGLC